MVTVTPPNELIVLVQYFENASTEDHDCQYRSIEMTCLTLDV